MDKNSNFYNSYRFCRQLSTFADCAIFVAKFLVFPPKFISSTWRFRMVPALLGKVFIELVMEVKDVANY